MGWTPSEPNQFPISQNQITQCLLNPVNFLFLIPSNPPKMILQDFIIQTKTGLFCSYGNFYLDPKEPVVSAVISHAHGDHAIGGNQNVYCTKPTAVFMQHRYK